MDKKYSSIIALLAFIGAVVAGILTYAHYYPGLDTKFVICGGNYAGNCEALTQWKYSEVFGIPIAVYGLFVFMLILFTSLIADYAGGKYLSYGFLLNSIFISTALLADLFLVTVMIRLETVCLLCAATYFINMLLLLTCYFWYRYSKKGDSSLRMLFQTMMPKETDEPDKKAAAALYVTFIIFLGFAVFSTAHILQMKTSSLKQSHAQTKQAVEAFYKQVPENPVLPESSLRIGNDNAKIQIVAFTDFLCSACFQFFQLENAVLTKYGDQISVTYYNYPLDQSCNSKVEQTVYKASCTAAKSFLAAASLNIFPEYQDKHFSRYQEFHSQYSKDKALEVAFNLTESVRFEGELASNAVNQILKRDIELADKLHINATPTLFINGRRMEGVPPRAVLEGIIERELKNISTK